MSVFCGMAEGAGGFNNPHTIYGRWVDRLSSSGRALFPDTLLDVTTLETAQDSGMHCGGVDASIETEYNR